jgi:hypothetical protein
MRKITKRSAAVAGAIVIAIGGGTAAFAYASGWFNGTGNLTATSATVQPVTATITAVGNVWPNHAAAASVSIGNFNQYPVTAKAVDTASPPVVTVFDNAAAANNNTPSTACAASDADIVLGAVVETTLAGGATKNVTFPNFVTMADTAHQNCAGKVFKVTFKINGEIAPDGSV